MILVDTSVWIDHFHKPIPALAEALERGDVLIHPFVIGELALGSLRDRDQVIGLLQALPGADVADDDEVLRFIGQNSLGGTGIGYVDVHLLAATRLTADARLWTRDKRLLVVAERLVLAVHPSH